MLYQISISVMVAFVGVAYVTGWLSFLFWLVVHLLFAILGFYYAVQWNLVCGKNYKPTIKPQPNNAINTIIKNYLFTTSNCPSLQAI